MRYDTFTRWYGNTGKYLLNTKKCVDYYQADLLKGL